MFEVLSTLLKYIFITIIYLFIYGIIRLIYLDIKTANAQREGIKSNSPYLKLINRRESFDFRIEETYTLDGKKDVGRSSKNEIIIKDPYISGKHARFIYREGKYYLEDIGSTNGTFVNGTQVLKDAVCLKDGDKIHIGQADFLFVSGMNGV